MGGRRGPNKIVAIYESDIVTVDTAVTITGIDITKPHCFVGAQFFSDADGDSPLTATTDGEVAITIQTINSQPAFENPITPTIEGSAPTTIDWAGNTLAVRGTPTGFTDDPLPYYRLVVTCNET